MTKPTMFRGTPKASIDSMARGSAASEVLVAKAIVAGSATARRELAHRNPRQQRRRKHAKQGKSDQRDIVRHAAACPGSS